MTHRKMFVAAAVFGLLSSSPAVSQVASLSLSGSGISGSLDLSYIANPNTGALPGTSPNPVDPVGSYIVSGITGFFSELEHRPS